MSDPTCKVCTTIGEQPDLPNTELAALCSTSEASIRRHRKAQHNAVDSILHDTDPFFTDIPTEIITSRGRSTRLPDGSWEKVTYNPAKQALLEAERSTYDDLLPLLNAPVAAHTVSTTTAAKNTKTGAHSAVLNVADLQIGKGKQRGGSTQDTVRRTKESVARFVEHVTDTRPAEIIVADNGDLIENIFSGGGGQAWTNDRSLIEQIRIARHLLADIIVTLAPLAPKVRVVSVPSNHGELRAGHQMQAGTIDDDFGLEINRMLEEQFEGREQFEHVTFVRPEPLYATAVVETSGTTLAFHHGHHTKGGQANHSKWWADQDHGRMPGWDADILVTAHWHNFRIEQSGDQRWIISCSAGETSSDWYTNTAGESSTRGLTGFDVKDGQWLNVRIY